jgi:hypothetical protein
MELIPVFVGRDFLIHTIHELNFQRRKEHANHLCKGRCSRSTRFDNALVSFPIVRLSANGVGSKCDIMRLFHCPSLTCSSYLNAI